MAGFKAYVVQDSGTSSALDSSFTNREHVEKLKLAARLVEEVAYAQAGLQSQQQVAHLMLVAATLCKLSGQPEDFAETAQMASLVNP